MPFQFRGARRVSKATVQVSDAWFRVRSFESTDEAGETVTRNLVSFGWRLEPVSEEEELQPFVEAYALGYFTDYDLRENGRIFETDQQIWGGWPADILFRRCERLGFVPASNDARDWIGLVFEGQRETIPGRRGREYELFLPIRILQTPTPEAKARVLVEEGIPAPTEVLENKAKDAILRNIDKKRGIDAIFAALSKDPDFMADEQLQKFLTRSRMEQYIADLKKASMVMETEDGIFLTLE